MIFDSSRQKLTHSKTEKHPIIQNDYIVHSKASGNNNCSALLYSKFVVKGFKEDKIDIVKKALQDSSKDKNKVSVGQIKFGKTATIYE